MSTCLEQLKANPEKASRDWKGACKATKNLGTGCDKPYPGNKIEYHCFPSIPYVFLFHFINKLKIGVKQVQT